MTWGKSGVDMTVGSHFFLLKSLSLWYGRKRDRGKRDDGSKCRTPVKNKSNKLRHQYEFYHAIFAIFSHAISTCSTSVLGMR